MDKDLKKSESRTRMLDVSSTHHQHRLVLNLEGHYSCYLHFIYHREVKKTMSLNRSFIAREVHSLHNG